MIKSNESYKYIGFYTWYQIFDEMSLSQQKDIITYIEEISKNIEKSINSSGGIAGKKVKIYRDIIQQHNASKEHYVEFLKQNKDIFFIPSFPNYASLGSEIHSTDGIILDNYIQLDQHGCHGLNGDEGLPWNIFSTEEWDGGDVWHFIKPHFKEKNLIFLINDGFINKKNAKKDKYSKELKKRINKAKDADIDFKIISNLHEDQSEFINYINALNEEDIIFLSLPSVIPLDSDEANVKNIFWTDIQIKILKAFTTNPSHSSLFLSHIDPRTLYDCLNYENALPNKKIFSRSHTSEGFFNYLRMQDIHYDVDPSMKANVSSYLSLYHYWQFNNIKLIQYIYDKKKYNFTNRKDFLKETSERLKLINGEDDIFIGDSQTLAFDEKHFNKINDSYLFQHKKISSDSDFIESILYKDQYKYDANKKDLYKNIKTNYINIDILRFSDISIEESIFTVKFYLELTTTNKEGINILAFNNSTLDSKSSIIEIDQHMIDDEYYYFRYLIEDTLSFNAIPDNYPFDKQLIFIDISIINEERYGVLQSPHVSRVDQKFQIDGWNLIQTRSGPFREKIKYISPVNDSKLVTQKISTKIGWIIERSSSMTLLKVLIPLTFLWMLVLYGLFLPIENLDRAVAVITTSFLSGIALYFSTERPQPLRMTVIDLVFAFFYSTVGIASLSVFSLNFFPNIYNEYMGFVKYFLPITVIIGYVFLRYRIKSRKFFPKMRED